MLHIAQYPRQNTPPAHTTVTYLIGDIANKRVIPNFL